MWLPPFLDGREWHCRERHLDAALQGETDARLVDVEAVAAAAGEQTRDADAPQWAQDESVDAAAAAAAAATATARREAKLWMCAACGKGHRERSAVTRQGGSYVCLERCGLMEGLRVRIKKRPRDARPAREQPLRQLRQLLSGVW